jgi:hypothetical protein
MRIPGVGPSSPRYPAEPPPSGPAAYGAAITARLAAIADKLQASQPLPGPTAALYHTAQSLSNLLLKITA